MVSKETVPRRWSAMAPSERYFSKVGAVAAIAGILVYVVSKGIHSWVPPHHTRVAFADYATDPNWVLIHLGELLGILLMTAAVIALTWRLRRGVAGVWAILGGAAMMLCAGVYAIFIAVDGVALGILVNRWAAAGPAQQEMIYETAFAVRQIEGGLFSIQWLLFGLAAGSFAGAFFASAESPVRVGWMSGMGWLSALASVGALAFGVVQAYGYSDLSMDFQTGLFPGVVWAIAIGVFLYRNPVHVETVEEIPRKDDDDKSHEPVA